MKVLLKKHFLCGEEEEVKFFWGDGGGWWMEGGGVGWGLEVCLDEQRGCTS